MGDYIYDCDYCGYSETSESPDIEGHLRTAHGITDYQEIKQARNDLQRDESTFDPYEEQMIFGEEAPTVDAPRGPDPNFPYGLSLDPIADYDRFAGKLSQPTTQDSMDDLDLHDELWGNDNTGSAFDNLTKFPLGGETKADELSPEAQCPNCGSYKTILEGKSSLGYGKRKQYVCQNCYNVFQSEYTPKQIRGFNESVASEFEFGGYSIKCDRCDGTGFTNQEIEFGGALECPDCNGTGKIEMTSSIPDSLSESKSNELNKTQFVKDFFDLDKAHLDIHGLLELQKSNESEGVCPECGSSDIESFRKYNTDLREDQGDPSDWEEKCNTCGNIWSWQIFGESKATEAYRDCYNCDGEGYINDSECPMCSGSGLIKKYDWEDVPDADTNFLPPEIVYGESEATEGGLGSGRGGHEPWMKEITELKANKHSIPSKNMTSNRFLKELASEDYGGLSGLRGITFKECPTCSGMGEVDDKFNLPYNRKFLEQNPDIEFGLPKECPDCGGKGQISEIDFGESKARETDADIAQAEADRVCPICGEKSPYIRMGDFWEKHFANNHTSYGFEPQSGESIAREDSSSNWFRPEDKNPKDNPSGMFIIDDDDDDDDIFDAMRRERYFQQDLDDEIGFNDDAAEANGRSVAQIKKDIKKMQEFIRVASLENPMNMGEWNSELEGLKAELASATESKKQIISKLQESNSMCRDCMNNFLAKASESIAFEEGIREECHDWRGFEIDCDSHKIIGKGYSSDKDWEDGKHLGQDWKTF